MTVLAAVAVIVIAAAVVGVPLYLMARQSTRRSATLTDALIAELRERFKDTPPLQPFVPLPIPDELPEPELRVTIRRQPEANGRELPQIAAAVIREVSRLEESYGGKGLEYDPVGSIEEPGRLVLRLVPRLLDWDAAERLTAVADELNRQVVLARSHGVGDRQTDIRSEIERELSPRLAPDAVMRVEEASVA